MRKNYLLIYSTLFSLLLGIIYLLIGNNSSFAAQIADSIARPTIGNKRTIQLESWYFGVTDSLTRIEYAVKRPDANIFTSSLVNASPSTSVNSNTFPLSPLSEILQLPPLVNEGIWQVIPMTQFPNQAVLAKTFIRPDNSRPYALVSLVKMNMELLSIGLQAGTYYPGGSRGMYGSGLVPQTIQHANSLVAVFNGGFQAKDGNYGMVLGNKTYVPLRNGLATFVIFSNGTGEIIDYEGQPLINNVIAARQNGAFLIKDGKITPYVENSVDTWGRTTTNSMYTWRSGIGITKDGNLMYAVGNSLVPQTLAKALLQAGAVNAMQLDINPYWVRFILYDTQGNGNYSYYSLLKDMHNGGYAYLHGYNKDFFYVYKKS